MNQTSGPKPPGQWPQQPPPQQAWPQQPPPQQAFGQQAQPNLAAQPALVAGPGQPLVFRLHAGARTAFTISGILLILLVVTIPVALWIFVRAASARLEITASELIVRGLFTTRRWTLSSMRRLGVLSVPVIAGGLGGALARKKVGGSQAIHLCAIDERGKKSNVLISTFERYPDVIQHVAAVTRLPVEEVKVGALSPKWPEPR